MIIVRPKLDYLQLKYPSNAGKARFSFESHRAVAKMIMIADVAHLSI